MKKLLALLGLFAISSAPKTVQAEVKPEVKPSQDFLTAKRMRSEMMLRERYLSWGLKEFNIDGIVVYAINRKNAERKASKKLAIA
jgi:hypothetical protein